MKKLAIGLLAIALLGGCANEIPGTGNPSGKELKVTDENKAEAKIKANDIISDYQKQAETEPVGSVEREMSKKLSEKGIEIAPPSNTIQPKTSIEFDKDKHLNEKKEGE